MVHGDVVSVARDGGTTEIAEVLDFDRDGLANLWYEETKKEERGVKLSDLTYTVEDKYVEPVPQNQKDLPTFVDTSAGAPKYKPDNKRALRSSISVTHELEPYDESLL